MTDLRRVARGLAFSCAFLLMVPPATRADDSSVEAAQEAYRNANRAYESGSREQAARLAQEAVTLDPSLLDAHRLLGSLAIERASRATSDAERVPAYAECAAHFRTAYGLKKLANLGVEAGICALKAGDPTAALRSLDETLAGLRAEHPREDLLLQDPISGLAEEGRATALAALGRTDEAMAAWETSIRANQACYLKWGGRNNEATRLAAYNDLRAKHGLPPTTVDAILVHASASSRVTPSAAPASSTVAATTVPPPAVSSECALAALNLSEAATEDSARVEAMYAGAKKFADAKDLRSICNVERKVHPILQRVIVRTEQVLSIQTTCPELGTEDLGGQAFLDETRSMVVRVARTIESCPPEQHHWQRVPVGGEARYLFERSTVSGHPAIWLRVLNDGKAIDQLYAVDCGGRRLAVVTTILYVDAAGTSVSSWAFEQSMDWKDNVLFTEVGPKACH